MKNKIITLLYHARFWCRVRHSHRVGSGETMEYLVASLYDNFIVGLGLGLSIWFVAFAAGSVLRLVWHIITK